METYFDMSIATERYELANLTKARAKEQPPSPLQSMNNDLNAGNEGVKFSIGNLNVFLKTEKQSN